MEFNVRNYYIADPGCVLVFMDADQQEYRLLGHYSSDVNFMKFIHEGKDIHSATAALLFGIPYEQVDKDMRGKGKTGNFA
jgi:DNA polymerase-1